MLLGCRSGSSCILVVLATYRYFIIDIRASGRCLTKALNPGSPCFTTRWIVIKAMVVVVELFLFGHGL